jgi:uncharacterized protein DUF6600
MTGRHCMRIFLTALLMSVVGLGGWSMLVPALAQDTGDAANAVVYQEPPEDVADVSVFYEPLAPYGTWTSLPEYGRVWIPNDMAPGWRPYTAGRWVYTSYGWTWVSEQEWGWAPFHYGRWAFVASYGWVWIPGTVWAPAWVVWRHTPGWVGWAPLPPQVVVRPGLEIRAATMNVRIEPSWFCFVEEHRILAPHVSTYIAPPARNVTLVQITQNVTHYTVLQNRVVNRGIPVERIERVIARPVPRMRIVEAQAPEAMHRAKVREREREVVLFRPAAPPGAEKMGARVQAPQSPPSSQFAPGTAFPQQPQDAHRPQGGAQTTLEERPRQTLPPRLQSLSPEELRVQRGAAQRALEEKARRDRQEREQQQAQQQLQQRQEHERQRILQQQQQAQERQRAFQQQQPQQQQQQQALERQRILQQQQQAQERQRAFQQQQQLQVQQQQALERQRAVLQQQQKHQPAPSQGMPPPAIQPPRAATQRTPEEGKEQRKKQPQPPPGQQPAQQ